MSNRHLFPYALALRNMMSDLSEDAYCAGWIKDNEYMLWGMVKGDIDPYYGMYAVSQDEIATLGTLAENAGVWFVWSLDDSEQNEAQPIPLDDWLPRYNAWVNNRPMAIQIHDPES